MCSRRVVLIALLGLSVSTPQLVAEQPQPGKVRLVHWLKNPKERLADRGFSTDGKLLLVGNNDDGSNYVRVWDPKEGKQVARCSLGKQSAYNITFAPDGKIVACSYLMAKEICLFDVDSAKLISRIAQPDYIREARFAPDGRTLISLSDGMRLWDVKTGKELWRLQLHLPEKSPFQLRERWQSHHTLALSPDGKMLAVGLEDGSIHLCDMANGVEVRRLFREVRFDRMPQLAFSPDGHYLATSALEDFPSEAKELPMSRFVIRLWEVRGGQLVRKFQQPIPLLPAKNALWLDVAACQRFIGKYRRDSFGLAFSPDGKSLANACFPTQLWEVATGQLRHEFDANTYGGCFSSDGRLFAVSGVIGKRRGNVQSDSIHLWDWRDPRLKQPINLSPRDLERLWLDLASDDAALGYRAMAMLLAHPERAAAVLQERLRRVEPLVPGELDRLLTNLDDDNFVVRERACERLARLGEVGKPALLRLKAQRPSLEVRRRIDDLLPRLSPAGLPDRLRCLRAVEILETVGSAEARRVLIQLASGAERAVETKDAEAALKRLTRKCVQK